MTSAWRKIILCLCIAVMELCWIYVFLFLLNDSLVKDGPDIIGLLIVYPVSFGAGLLLHRLKIHRIARRTISWILWAIVTLLLVRFFLYHGVPWADNIWLLAIPQGLGQIFSVFRPELLILIATALLWWFGSRLVRLNMDFKTLVFEFQLSLPILLGLFVLTFVIDIDIQSIPLALLFFFFALLGLSISHEQEGAGWLSGIYRGRWSALLIITIVIVLGLGLLVGMLVSRDFVQLILDGLNWVWNSIMKIIDWFVSLFPMADQGPPPPPETSTIPGSPNDDTGVFRIPEQLRQILGNGWAIAMLVLCLIALWRLAQIILGWLRKRQSPSEATIASVRGGLKTDLMKLLRWLARLFRIKLPEKAKPVQREVVTVRHLYRQLLHWAAAHGLPRKNTQTPDEYLVTLVNHAPGVASELDLITKAYDGVRYGHQIPGENELNELKVTLRRIKTVRIAKPVTEPANA